MWQMLTRGGVLTWAQTLAENVGDSAAVDRVGPQEGAEVSADARAQARVVLPTPTSTSAGLAAVAPDGAADASSLPSSQPLREPSAEQVLWPSRRSKSSPEGNMHDRVKRW
jgi:hypothetical protein